MKMSKKGRIKIYNIYNNKRIDVKNRCKNYILYVKIIFYFNII